MPRPDDADEAGAQELTDECVELIGQGLAAVAADHDVAEALGRHAAVPAAADTDQGAIGGTLLDAVKTLVQQPRFQINRVGGPLGEPPLVVAVTGLDSSQAVGRIRGQLVALLLENGADPDVPELHPMAVDSIIRAAVLNHFVALRQLAAAMPPLALAAALNERPAINGQTALHDSVHRALTAAPGTLDNHLEQIRWAVDHGARTDIEDLTGVTVADHARLAQHDSLLAQHAAAVLAALDVDGSTSATPPAKRSTRAT